MTARCEASRRSDQGEARFSGVRFPRFVASCSRALERRISAVCGCRFPRFAGLSKSAPFSLSKSALCQARQQRDLRAVRTEPLLEKAMPPECLGCTDEALAWLAAPTFDADDVPPEREQAAEARSLWRWARCWVGDGLLVGVGLLVLAGGRAAQSRRISSKNRFAHDITPSAFGDTRASTLNCWLPLS